MFIKESIKMVWLGIIAGLLIGITIKLTAIQKAVDSYFVSQDEYIELCNRLGGKMAYSVLNYPDCF